MTDLRLRVLLVPDSVHWVTGTIAKSIAHFNPWIEATIASGPVIDVVLNQQPELMRNFDLVHFTCPYASREWLPRFRDLVPCVTSHHHVSDWDLLKHNLDGDAIIVGSPEWAEDLRARGGDLSKVFWVPYGVDAEQFKPATDAERLAIRNKLGISRGATLVGFFGKNSSNEHDRKGLDVFTEAILGLKQRLPELTVLLVGPGWKDLASSFSSAGVQCLWFPFVRNLSGLREMYHALDFYWVTARVEGGPVPLLEAMSSEVCCLTTAVGIAREIVRDGENAVLLPFNDVAAFVERTALLASDESERRRLGRNARQTILKEMHVGVTAPRVREVYAKAFENFAARTGSEPRAVATGLGASIVATLSEPRADRGPRRGSPAGVVVATGSGTQNKPDDVPLHGFPRAIHRRVKMLEALAWSEHLILYHRQRSVALRMITREWLRNPLSLLPARVLLRRFLPMSLVARVVKLKNGSRRKPRVLADYSPSEKM
jgi:glycosyltransferase involved in cell wall biosynthesis